jgi:D-glycero-alpha-D-manno-heptose 1-phosphate guanylyltransferase
MHTAANAECVLSLKPMTNMQRYGVVELTGTNAVASFKEKQFYNSGLINGGVYALNVASFIAKTFTPQFSFEKDYLEAYYKEGKIFGCIQEGYFIDIGIPEDYLRANADFQNFNLISSNV